MNLPAPLAGGFAKAATLKRFTVVIGVPRISSELHEALIEVLSEWLDQLFDHATIYLNYRKAHTYAVNDFYPLFKVPLLSLEGKPFFPVSPFAEACRQAALKYNPLPRFSKIGLLALQLEVETVLRRWLLESYEITLHEKRKTLKVEDLLPPVNFRLELLESNQGIATVSFRLYIMKAVKAYKMANPNNTFKIAKSAVEVISNYLNLLCLMVARKAGFLLGDAIHRPLYRRTVPGYSRQTNETASCSRQTITDNEIHTTAALLFSGELSRYARLAATRALETYSKSSNKKLMSGSGLLFSPTRCELFLRDVSGRVSPKASIALGAVSEYITNELIELAITLLTKETEIKKRLLTGKLILQACRSDDELLYLSESLRVI